jgi:hypothetical protein
MNILFHKVSRFLNKTLFLIALLILSIPGHSQEIHLNCTDEPLNKTLIGLRDRYGLMVSFDDTYLAGFKITIQRKFSSGASVMEYLLKDLPLKYDLRNGVYIIYKFIKQQKVRSHILSGTISDITNHESLPFAGILINSKGFFSDARGNFSHTSLTDSMFAVKISCLGYYILDTIIPAGTYHNFRLIPSVIAMKEIVVTGSPVEKSIQTGTSPGTIKLNQKTAYFLPGNGDNEIFNLLRLQPGILAAGEQSSDLMIWGSYEGQSQIVFDGFTIYGMKNFNDNISAVNPFMAKDMNVLKGGFGAEYGEKVGGIVNITGIDGNRLSPSFQVNVNNMTLNGMTSVPFRKKSSILIAYRQTYYNLYNPVKYSSASFGRGRQSGGADYYLVPEYLFRDMNIKYSGSGRKSNYYISLYGGGDDFVYHFNEDNLQRTYQVNYHEKNLQTGGTAFYGFRWNESNTTNLTLSYSNLKTDREYFERTEREMGNQVISSINDFTVNNIDEFHGRTDNKITLSENHTADIGLGLIRYSTRNEIETIRDTEKAIQIIPYLYLQDNMVFLDKITLRPGVRADLHPSGRILFQPRFSAIYNLNHSLRINTAFGIYNQFVAKNMIVDVQRNFRLVWALCDADKISVLNSNSYSLGISYNRNNVIISLEGYIRSIKGITRFIESTTGTQGYEGTSRTKGLDFFVKKDFKKQSVWIAYTLHKTLEKFPYFPTEDYLPAQHDQRHELKVAGLFKLGRFHFSACYVYGSGFPDPDLLPALVDYTSPYSRLDADMIYRISARKIHIDAGFSILNVLNTENIRYSNYTRIPSDESATVSLYAEAVPFTPALFLRIFY